MADFESLATDEVIECLRRDHVNPEFKTYEYSDNYFKTLMNCLREPPKVTCVRANTALTDVRSAAIDLQNILDLTEGENLFIVKPHSIIPDSLVIFSKKCIDLETDCNLPKLNCEVIVSEICGNAVLRGADVFAPGILGAPSGMHHGTEVSVYVDLVGKCLKGFKKRYKGPKMFLGNGVALLNRHELFKGLDNVPNGVAIKIKTRIFPSPSLGKEILGNNLFLQNLPSIVCSHILDPKEGALILDMCAAPGGKTTHIAALIRNNGKIIALDKSFNKIAKIKENADRLGATCIDCYSFDSTKALDESSKSTGCPPYASNTFDFILLDGPCSALGQRPSLTMKIKSVKELKSYARLQRKLIEVAVRLVKFCGTMVYSTCTITLAENEEQVKWILDNFPFMELVPQTPKIGSSGRLGTGLSKTQCEMLQRFEIPNSLEGESDSIGFFIAKFVKMKAS